MGNCSGKQKENIIGYEDIIGLQAKLQSYSDVSIQLQVAHFTPATFPMIPVVTHETHSFCSQSWNIILEKKPNQDIEGNDYGLSGVTAFYSEFYDRLDKVDANGHFEAVLSRHSGNDEQSKISAKGAILVRIIKFAISVAKNTNNAQMTLYMLGKSHSQKSVRPWQYSVFVQTLLQTIASRLETQATNDVMEAWVNLFAFILRSMLPPAIEGQVVENEMNVNTSSEFAAGKVLEEVAEIEEVKAMKKKIARSVGGSSRSQSVASASSFQ